MNNRYRDQVGCEVNVCQAKQCDQEFARKCALRKYYNMRVQSLIAGLHAAKGNRAKEIYRKLLNALEVVNYE